MDGLRIGVDWGAGESWTVYRLKTSAGYRILSRVCMFSDQERERIELRAIEQAMIEAKIAHAELEPLLPVDSTWPFPLSEDDRAFLRVNKISAA